MTKLRFIKILVKILVKNASKRVLIGRYKDKNDAEKGRFIQAEIQEFLKLTFLNFDQLLKEADLKSIKSHGNRVNVMLTVLTLAGYRAFIQKGIPNEYATELIADMGWKVYVQMLKIPRFVAKIIYRNPLKQMNLMLQLLMIYPFSGPGYIRKIKLAG